MLDPRVTSGAIDEAIGAKPPYPADYHEKFCAEAKDRTARWLRWRRRTLTGGAPASESVTTARPDIGAGIPGGGQ
jgi:hypothetical protein